ncbi:TetR/AcrR family transcriptional regulator [Fluviispira vulneris]|uniref:TetR/AcrR family transcriptional regulator n=1 Tax=Fluviispira vulneris TaxID=2763012 RepID=UPI0016495D87|nr:TetR/AcrR family transcriptional regulator [Fluviispira vulneris]
MKNQIIQKLINEFRKFGYEGLSLRQISEATGLGKASLYHYFPSGKKEMALEVMKAASEWIKNDLDSLMDSDLLPEKKLEKLVNILSEFYQNGKNACLLDVMTIDNCSNNNFFIESKNILLNLTNIFYKMSKEFGHSEENAARKAQTALSLLQGALIQSRILEDNNIFAQQFLVIQSILQNK